jgi:hypothetical protein
MLIVEDLAFLDLLDRDDTTKRTCYIYITSHPRCTFAPSVVENHISARACKESIESISVHAVHAKILFIPRCNRH